ncbi:MAG TPA: protein kinase [Gemmatimonadales bacterium]|nr:protein kinase [Gemmatimonadales bacterium]
MKPLADRLQEALGTGYEVGDELPGGGMSRLFLAVDRTLGRQVVVKVLPEDRLFGISPDRFQREIRLTASLSHANIVGILGTGVMDGVPFYIMPFVEGRSLRTLLDESGRLSVRETVSILRDVARACAFAHAKGIIHRDIKPGNVLLAGGAAVMTDFGVAKAIASSAEPESTSSDSTLTRAGFTIGTPAYMAPEQAAGDRDLDQRADIYSLGVMAFEMLSGRVPFEGMTPRELLTAQLTLRPPDLATLRPELPPALTALVRACLAKDPADRPASAEQVLATLDELPVTGGSHPSLAVVRRQQLIRRVVVAAGALVVLLAGVQLARGRSGTTTPDPVSTLAVLPFVSRSADSADAYLAEGLTDALSSALARDPTVQVASRLAAAEYAERSAPPAEIGRSLKVSALLDGSVQRQGDRIRVTVQLVDTRNGAALWSESYDRQNADLLQVQADIAQAIVTALQRRRGGKPQKAEGKGSGFHVAEAYDRYLQGRYAFGQRGAERLREAIGHFQAAVELDSTAARAYSGLADAYVLLPLYGDLPVDSALALALLNADRAVRLDSSSAEVLASRGVVHLHRWEWAAAEADLDRALRLDPRYAAAHQWRGELDLVAGRFGPAAARFREAIALDSAAPVPLALYGLALGAAGSRDSAIATARQAVRLDPSLAAIRLLQGAVLLYAGESLKAVGALEAALALEPDNEQALGLLGLAYARLGDSSRSRTIAAKLSTPPLRPSSYSALAKVQLGLGERDKALGALEKAASRHEPFFASEPLRSPLFAPLEGDPRLAALRRTIGLR